MEMPEIYTIALIGFVSSLAGAGFGALAANWYSNRKDKEMRKEKHHGISIALLYQLLSYFSAVENFARGFLNKERNALKPELSNSLLFKFFPSNRIDYSKLTFLVDSKDAQFVYDLSIVESKYFSFVDSVLFRNEQLKKIVDSTTYVGRHPERDTSIREGIDPDELKLLNDMTRDLVGSCDKTAVSISDVIKQVEQVIARRFPGLPCPSSETVPEPE